MKAEPLWPIIFRGRSGLSMPSQVPGNNTYRWNSRSGSENALKMPIIVHFETVIVPLIF